MALYYNHHTDKWQSDAPPALRPLPAPTRTLRHRLVPVARSKKFGDDERTYTHRIGAIQVYENRAASTPMPRVPIGHMDEPTLEPWAEQKWQTSGMSGRPRNTAARMDASIMRILNGERGCLSEQCKFRSMEQDEFDQGYCPVCAIERNESDG